MITKQEQTAYRYRHHDFGGLSTAATALKMGVTQRHVQRLLQSLKAKAPQLFPILTPQQAQDYHRRVSGWSIQEIADYTDRTMGTVSLNITRAVKRGMPVPCQRGRIPRYTPEMDAYVTEKF